jgi:hypothetical protein
MAAIDAHLFRFVVILDGTGEPFHAVTLAQLSKPRTDKCRRSYP